MRSYVASALDGPVGIALGGAARRRLEPPPSPKALAHGLATQRLFAATIAAAECELRERSCTAPGPGAGHRDRRGFLGAPPHLGSATMDPTNANTALASAFVEELARGGLRRAVVSPGSRSTPLAVALWRQPEIEVTVIVDERSAAFFALGAAQATASRWRCSAPRERPPPTTTPRSPRPTYRGCRSSC